MNNLIGSFDFCTRKGLSKNKISIYNQKRFNDAVERENSQQYVYVNSWLYKGKVVLERLSLQKRMSYEKVIFSL